MSVEIESFCEERIIGDPPKRVKVVVKKMKLKEARSLFPYRPHSKYAESRWGGYGLATDDHLLSQDMAFRCTMCEAPTRLPYLKNGICPDCDGRSEYDGTNHGQTTHP
jgi:hypothetical protein